MMLTFGSVRVEGFAARRLGFDFSIGPYPGFRTWFAGRDAAIAASPSATAREVTRRELLRIARPQGRNRQ